MPLDDELMLRDGTVALDSDEDAVPVVVLAADEHGANAVDIRGTGAKGLVAVLNCPTAPTGTYGVTLVVKIQATDHYATDDTYVDVADFPVLWTWCRRVRTQASSTVFNGAAIGQTLTASGSGATDTGTILWYDPALEVNGGIGDIVVAMVASDDTYAVVGATLTSGDSGGIGTSLAAGEATAYRSYGNYFVRFRTDMRYVRAYVLAGATAAWGSVQIGLTNAGM